MVNFKIDYIFLNQDNSKDLKTLEETHIPNTGDGKVHNNKHYEIIFKGENLISRPNPLVLAVEIGSKP